MVVSYIISSNLLAKCKVSGLPVSTKLFYPTDCLIKVGVQWFLCIAFRTGCFCARRQEALLQLILKLNCKLDSESDDDITAIYSIYIVGSGCWKCLFVLNIYSMYFGWWHVEHGLAASKKKSPGLSEMDFPLARTNCLVRWHVWDTHIWWRLLTRKLTWNSVTPSTWKPLEDDCSAERGEFQGSMPVPHGECDLPCQWIGLSTCEWIHKALFLNLDQPHLQHKWYIGICAVISTYQHVLLSSIVIDMRFV